WQYLVNAGDAASTNSVARPLLDPERLAKGFYSIFFTAIPLSLGTGYFLYVVHQRDGQSKFEPFFGGGQLIQLLVILLVAGNVCSLAIMGILNGSEVAAIYGGIVGYVLGKTSRPETKIVTGATAPKTEDADELKGTVNEA